MEGIIDELIMANECFTEEQINTYMNIGAEGVLAVKPVDKLAITWAAIK
ncbi:hypothetical protein GF312_01985 [Candidatus Poribacteria bacterium]|nr:hypothetical protein [Candidatus Poribacteria bacterium]